MSHPYVRNYYHLIFSTKDRRPFIKPLLQSDVYDEIRYVAVKYGASVEAIGGTEDHVHVLLQMPAKLAVAAVVCALKAKSSKRIVDHGHLLAWQSGYGCFTVSSSAVPAVREYIGKQEEHHRKRGFDDELAAILKKHGIERRTEGSFMDSRESTGEAPSADR